MARLPHAPHHNRTLRNNRAGKKKTHRDKRGRLHPRYASCSRSFVINVVEFQLDDVSVGIFINERCHRTPLRRQNRFNAECLQPPPGAQQVVECRTGQRYPFGFWTMVMVWFDLQTRNRQERHTRVGGVIAAPRGNQSRSALRSPVCRRWSGRHPEHARIPTDHRPKVRGCQPNVSNC
jgi:hypothetical protein